MLLPVNRFSLCKTQQYVHKVQQSDKFILCQAFYKNKETFLHYDTNLGKLMGSGKVIDCIFRIWHAEHKAQSKKPHNISSNMYLQYSSHSVSHLRVNLRPLTIQCCRFQFKEWCDVVASVVMRHHDEGILILEADDIKLILTVSRKCQTNCTSFNHTLHT